VGEFAAGPFDEVGVPDSGWAHRHSFYEILLVREGVGTHMVEFETYPIRPNALYFLVPGQVHCWTYETPPSGHVVLFTEEFLPLPPAGASSFGDRWHFAELSERGEIAPSATQAAELVRLIDCMIRERRNTPTDYRTVLQAYLHIFITYARRLGGPTHSRREAGRASLLVGDFLDLLRQRSVGPVVSAYSHELGVTPGHLAETVKRMTGKTPGQHIRNMQLVEAKRLLAYTEKTVAEIAYELGFKDAAYFGRFFKRELGCTPGEFRKDARLKASGFPKA
jgi:AraC-like DNA-binding protein